MPQAVLFDCDGTLVESETTCSRALTGHINELGYAITFDETVARFTGVKLDVVFDEIATELGRTLPADNIEVFRRKQLAALREGVTPIAGAEELLAGLKLPYCVASNAPQVKIRLCLESAGLLRFFDDATIFSAYDVQVWKPDPALFLHAAEQLGAPPAECVVVEDSPPGIEAGLAAGMRVFALDESDRLPVQDESVRRFGSLAEMHAALRESVS